MMERDELGGFIGNPFSESLWSIRHQYQPKRKEIIIVEGPDGCGKSTMVRALQAKREIENVKTVHHGPYLEKCRSELLQTYLASINSFKEDKNFDIMIMDRCWVSEFIYGPIVRGSSRLRLSDLDIIREALDGMDVKIVFVQPPLWFCRTNWERDLADEYVGDSEHFEAIVHEYRKHNLNTWGLPTQPTDPVGRMIDGI